MKNAVKEKSENSAPSPAVESEVSESPLIGGADDVYSENPSKDLRDSDLVDEEPLKDIADRVQLVNVPILHDPDEDEEFSID